MPAKKDKKSARKQQSIPKKRSGQWLWIWLALTGVAMLSATAGALLAVSINTTPLRQASLSPEEEAIFSSQGATISRGTLRLPELTRPVHILVLGVKVLTSDVPDPSQANLGYHALVNSFEGRSDSMLLLRFDPEKEGVTVLSIPRDTRAEIEGYGVTKINAANDFGGPALAAKATSALLDDIPIDRYVRVNVQGVEKLIDALGGVNVYVPTDMKYRDDSQRLYIDLKEGQQHLNGHESLQFLRFRYDRYGDIGRVQRQQMFMRSLVEQALNPATVVKIPKILSIIQSHIDTNLSVEELVALVGFASQAERSKVQMVMLPGDFNGTGRDEVSYWLPNRRAIREVLAQHFDQAYTANVQSSDPAYRRIAIQDSTGEADAVQALAATLQKAGYRNVYVHSEWREPLAETRIVAQGGDEELAHSIYDVLGLGDVRVESTGALQSDITIQLGRDWLQQRSSRTDLVRTTH